MDTYIECEVPTIFHAEGGQPVLPQAMAVVPHGFEAYGREWLQRSIPARFEYQVERRPAQVAIETATERLTYAEFNARANGVAHGILERCGPAPEPVAVLVADDLHSVLGLFAVLKAGKFAVLINGRSPLATINAQLADAQPPLIVTDGATGTLAASVQDAAGAGCELLRLDAESGHWPTTNPEIPLSGDSYAQILYTSGTTGQPKGIIMPHRMLLHQSMAHINGYYINSDDRLMVPSPITFGAPQSAVYAGLLAGATILPYDMKRQGIMQLADWLLAERVTIFNSVATFFRQFVHTLRNQPVSHGEPFPHLRLIKLGGEALYRKDVEAYKRCFGNHTVIRAGLASSESGIMACHFIGKEIGIDSVVVPAGYPLVDKELWFLDDEQQPVAPGQVGEIGIRSDYMADGYWQAPERTAEKFLPDPDGGNRRIYRTGDLGRMRPDGMLEHLGRKDFMVKIRGFRVELGAIEGALLEIDAIEYAVVVARENASGTKQLVAYLVAGEGVTAITLRKTSFHALRGSTKTWNALSDAPAPVLPALTRVSGADAGASKKTFHAERGTSRLNVMAAGEGVPTVNALREALSQKLPDYMVPLFFVYLDALPLLPNGKVNRNALPPPDTGRPELSTPFVAPRTALEQTLAQLWTELLSLGEVGVNDNFFDLGGDSLLAMRMTMRVAESHHYQVPVPFFAEPTIARLAQYISGACISDTCTSDTWTSDTCISDPDGPMAQPVDRPANKYVSQPVANPTAVGPLAHSRALLKGHLLHAGPLWREQTLPYAAGVQVQQQFIKFPPARARLLPRSQMLQTWQAQMGCMDRDGHQQDLSILANTWYRWREKSLLQADVFAQWVTVQGGDILRTALASQRPIILISAHTAIRAAAIKMAVQAQSTRSLWLLGGHNRGPMDAFAKVTKARASLLQGNMIIVMGDGAQGNQGVEIPLGGRPWFFRSGAAELALSTHALLLPVFNTMDRSGRVTVEFLEPLSSSLRTERAQIEDLTRQYAELLNARWPDLLCQMQWGKLKQIWAYGEEACEPPGGAA